MKSLDTALRVLQQFAGAQPDLGVGEISEKLGLPKSQVSKILSAFRQSGLLVQNQTTRRYGVGARAYALGARFINYDRLTREALPTMRNLVERTGHSARLSVMVGDDILYLVGIEGPLFLDTSWRAGQWLPPHATSAGRVLLAFEPEDRALRILKESGLPALTAETETDLGKLSAMMEAIRGEGFHIMRNETTPGLATIGVPIMAEQQNVVGAFTLVFPSHVLAPAAEPGYVAILHKAARVLSQRLGCPLYPFGNDRT
ncbi:DNA-binding IclR family transcriptional regulator [Rhodoligotrophos appendicifer]|uniref:IclR family transcriptional regulator n=1 Tax=Rhodoligotrophos appendicifer TaxID=987056 RepID=UPI0011864BC2|nr:IclR family transcriptional regulator [Rhodoligotrophos appendicifer]